MKGKDSQQKSYGSGPALTSRPLRRAGNPPDTPVILQDHWEVPAELLAQKMMTRARRLALVLERVFD